MPSDYEHFRRQDRDGRLRIFNTLNAEEKAELLRSQIRTWVEEHRERLTPQQIGLMEENIAFVTADIYKRPRDPELQERQKDLIARTSAQFGFDQMAQALTVTASDMPDFEASIELAGIPTDPQFRIGLNVCAARNETTRVRIRAHPESEDERVLAEWHVDLEEVTEGRRGTAPDPPVKRMPDILTGLRLHEVCERVRITITPEREGVRIFASALVRGADDQMEVIQPKRRAVVP